MLLSFCNYTSTFHVPFQIRFLLLTASLPICLSSTSCIFGALPAAPPMLVSFCSTGQRRCRKLEDKPRVEPRLSAGPTPPLSPPHGQIGPNPIFRLQPKRRSRFLSPDTGFTTKRWDFRGFRLVAGSFASTNRSAPVLNWETKLTSANIAKSQSTAFQRHTPN